MPLEVRNASPELAANRVRHLANAIHSHRSKVRMLLVVNRVSYMDETGHADDPSINYVGMGGFVAPAGNWEVLSAEWQTTLNNAGLKQPFHMKEFAHSVKQFASWKGNETDRKRLYGQLIKHIRDAKPMPVGAIVSLRDYASLTDAQQKSFRDPYYLAFQTATRGAALEAFAEPDGETVAMVYSYNGEYGTNNGGGAEQLWHHMKRIWEHGNLMGSYASSTPEELCPLQAADVFAYELSHDFERMITCPTASMRWGLKQILRLYPIPLAQIRFLDRREMLRIIRSNGNYPDKTGVEELGVEIDEINSAQRRMFEWVTTRGEYEPPFEV